MGDHRYRGPNESARERRAPEPKISETESETESEGHRSKDKRSRRSKPKKSNSGFWAVPKIKAKPKDDDYNYDVIRDKDGKLNLVKWTTIDYENTIEGASAEKPTFKYDYDVERHKDGTRKSLTRRKTTDYKNQLSEASTGKKTATKSRPESNAPRRHAPKDVYLNKIEEVSEEDDDRGPAQRPVAQGQGVPPRSRGVSPTGTSHHSRSRQEYKHGKNEILVDERSRLPRNDPVGHSNQRQNHSRGFQDTGYDQVGTSNPRPDDCPRTQAPQNYQDAQNFDNLDSPPSCLPLASSRAARSPSRVGRSRYRQNLLSRGEQEHTAMHPSSSHATARWTPPEPQDVMHISPVHPVEIDRPIEDEMHNLKIGSQQYDSTSGHRSQHNSRTTSRASTIRASSKMPLTDYETHNVPVEGKTHEPLSDQRSVHNSRNTSRASTIRIALPIPSNDHDTQSLKLGNERQKSLSGRRSVHSRNSSKASTIRTSSQMPSIDLESQDPCGSKRYDSFTGQQSLHSSRNSSKAPITRSPSRVPSIENQMYTPSDSRRDDWITDQQSLHSSRNASKVRSTRSTSQVPLEPERRMIDSSDEMEESSENEIDDNEMEEPKQDIDWQSPSFNSRSISRARSERPDTFGAASRSPSRPDRRNIALKHKLRDLEVERQGRNFKPIDRDVSQARSEKPRRRSPSRASSSYGGMKR